MKNALFLLLTLLLTANSYADSTQPPVKGACEGKYPWIKTNAAYKDFRFWVGDWIVVDSKSGELRGFDKVTLQQNGCQIHQKWQQLDNTYTVPNTPWRLTGNSISGINPEGKWRQLWMDNSGNNFLLTGELKKDGTMELTSETLQWTDQKGQIFKAQYQWYWKENSDGSVRSWGVTLNSDPKQKPAPLFDITYYRNDTNGPQFKLSKKP